MIDEIRQQHQCFLPACNLEVEISRILEKWGFLTADS